ncbi:MAG: VWA domain-containing protein [Myxococcota bacterium]
MGERRARIAGSGQHAATALVGALLAFQALACGGGEGDSTPFDAFSRDGRDSGTTKPDGGIVIIGADATPDAEVADAAPPISCVPNKRTCTSDTSWALCAKSGKSHGLESQCAGGALCDPDTGLCKIPFCLPKARECVGLSTYQICNPSGTGWETELRHCAIDQVCSGGECRTCFPDALACANTTTPGQCNAAGDAITPLAACPADQACHEFTGQCRPKICSPGAPSCASLTSYHDCLPSGTGYDSLVRGCFEGSLCKNSQCVLSGCVPLVMLLVDRSGSMTGKWSAVRSSVKGVVAENPAAAFGLMAFPTDGGCASPTFPSLPLNYQSQAELDSWFDLTPSTGATPLAYSVRAAAIVAESIWGASGGALVVLTDGDDTCLNTSDPADMLATWTAVLLAEHNVRTYVIGYSFDPDGDVSQLDAIAANGGTEFTSYLAAGNEGELKNAFKSVISDFKSCVTPAN